MAVGVPAEQAHCAKDVAADVLPPDDLAERVRTDEARAELLALAQAARTLHLDVHVSPAHSRQAWAAFGGPVDALGVTAAAQRGELTGREPTGHEEPAARVVRRG